MQHSTYLFLFNIGEIQAYYVDLDEFKASMFLPRSFVNLNKIWPSTNPGQYFSCVVISRLPLWASIFDILLFSMDYIATASDSYI
jgi:hypothetical protein